MWTVARPRPRSAPRSISQAPPNPITGEMASAAPTSPPTSAWLELEGSPFHQVTMLQTTAAVSKNATSTRSAAGRVVGGGLAGVIG
jgi:hypothetical protein